MKNVGLFVVIALTLNCGGGSSSNDSNAISYGSGDGSQIGSYNDDGGWNDGGGVVNNVDVPISTGNGSDGDDGGDGDAPVFVNVDGDSNWNIDGGLDSDNGNDGSDASNGNVDADGKAALAALKELEDNGSIPKLERSGTVQGVDIGMNGIRDDVEEYILAHYNVPTQQKAALQFATSVQLALLVDPTDSESVQNASKKMVSAVSCIYARFDADIEPETVVSEVRSISTNTKTRLLAYLAFGSALDGTVMTLPEGDSCE